MFSLSFIDEKSFKKHVQETVSCYNRTSHTVSLKDFNANVIDPIKLLFDKMVFGKSVEDIINEAGNALAYSQLSNADKDKYTPLKESFKNEINRLSSLKNKNRNVNL